VQWQTRKLSGKKTTKVLVVGYSGVLPQAAAQALSVYRLVAAGKDKKIGTKDDKVVGLVSAAYDPAARTVTLTPRGKVPNQAVQLTIDAASLLDGNAQSIDGNGDGQPGGDFRATLGKGGIGLASTARAGLRSQGR
jgi:hypothetical protein